MFYDTKTKNPTKMYSVLNCFLYYFIDNYFRVNYLCCHSNDVKLRIHVINKQKTDYVMAFYTEISSVENTVNKLQTLSTFHYVYQQNLYRDEQKEMEELVDEYQIPLLENIGNPALIQ